MTEPKRQPRLISFSGMDGAGKSTQIANLHDALKQAGYEVRVLAFWDDVAMLGRAREFLCYRLFRGDRGVGAPGKPVNRRDKNVLTWYTTLARFFLYAVDALGLAAAVARVSKTRADVVIFDRYLYDELANLPLHHPVAHGYARWLLKRLPAPHVAYLLDADPAQARARKPEYPLEFLQRNRDSYLALATLAPEIIVIPQLSPQAVAGVIQQTTSAALREQRESFLRPAAAEPLPTNR